MKPIIQGPLNELSARISAMEAELKKLRSMVFVISGSVDGSIEDLSGSVDGAIHDLSGSVDSAIKTISGGGLTSVTTDSTLTGQGTAVSPLSAATLSASIDSAWKAGDAATAASLRTGVTSSVGTAYSSIQAGVTSSIGTAYSSLQAGSTASIATFSGTINADFVALWSVAPSIPKPGDVSGSIDGAFKALSGTINAAFANAVVGTLTDTGDLRVSGSITGSGDVTLGRNLTVASSLTASAGAKFTGPVDMNFQLIDNLHDPVNLQDAATKNYVDAVSGTIDSRFLNLTGSLISKVATAYSSLQAGSTSSIAALSGTVNSAFVSLWPGGTKPQDLSGSVESSIRFAVAGGLSGGTANLIGIRKFTSNQTYIPSSGTVAIIVEMIGGGGGGGAVMHVSGVYTAAGGGASGVYWKKYFSSLSSATGTVVVGAGGTAGATGTLWSQVNGGTGGDTTFSVNGTTYASKGGPGGSGSFGYANMTSFNNWAPGGFETGGTSAGDLSYSQDGEWGTIGTPHPQGGRGGSTQLGAGGKRDGSTTTPFSVTGTDGRGYGAGGGGASGIYDSYFAFGGEANGGSGSNGVVFVYEYAPAVIGNANPDGSTTSTTTGTLTALPLSGTVDARFLNLTGSLISGLSHTYTSLQAGVTSSVATLSGTVDARFLNLTGSLISKVATAYSSLQAGSTASINTLSGTINSAFVSLWPGGTKPQDLSGSIDSAIRAASSVGSGGYLKLQVFLTSSVYAPTAGTNHIIVEMIGGGGGGGASSYVSGTKLAAAGGASGMYWKKSFTLTSVTGNVVIGAGGTAGVVGALWSQVNGGTGGSTFFSINGVTYVSKGGTGGSGSFGTNSTTYPQFAAQGGYTLDGSSHGDLMTNEDGGHSYTISDGGMGGNGGGTPLGNGGINGKPITVYGGSNATAITGSHGKGFGAGGGGGHGFTDLYGSPHGGSAPGGSGSQGVVMIYEFT